MTRRSHQRIPMRRALFDDRRGLIMKMGERSEVLLTPTNKIQRGPVTEVASPLDRARRVARFRSGRRREVRRGPGHNS